MSHTRTIEIDALTDVMQDMRTKFSAYCNAVVHIGTTGLELADGVHKFNQKHRPGHLPSLSFAQVQYAFREQLRLKWARQFKEEAIYMFEHWYKQSEAQKNTIANFEIARQHCHHLKAQLLELLDQRAKLVEKNKPVPPTLTKESADADQQFRKYSTALDSMRAAIVSNQQRLTGPQGQFVYFDKAFATLLEMQVSLEREMRRVVDAYEPLIAAARQELGAPNSGLSDRAAAVGDAQLREDEMAMTGFERQLKEMAEFVVQTHLEQDDGGGAAASPLKRNLEVDALLQQFVASAPPTPQASGDGAGAGSGRVGGLRLSLGATGSSAAGSGGAGSGDLLSAPSPRLLASARKKKRLSWGVNAGVSTVDSPVHGATPLKGSLAEQAIAEEPEDGDNASVSSTSAAAAASEGPALTGDAATRALARRSLGAQYGITDSLMETDIDAYLEGQFDDAADEDDELHLRAAAASASGSDHAVTDDSAVHSGLLALPSAPSTAASALSTPLEPAEPPAVMLAKTAAWRDAADSVSMAAGAISAAGDGHTGLPSDGAVDWPADLIVRDFELQSWESRAGRRKPLRELLATLQLALWPGVSWKVVTIASMAGWAGVAAVFNRAWAAVAPVAEAARKELGAAAAGSPATALAALGDSAVGVKYMTALRVASALAIAMDVEVRTAGEL